MKGIRQEVSVVGRESGRGRAKIRAKEKKIWKGVRVYSGLGESKS